MQTHQAPIELAVEIAGGTVSLARLLKVSAPTVSEWIKRRRRIPAERCLQIEAATSHRVRCESLRPDVRWDVMFRRPGVHVNSLGVEPAPVHPNTQEGVV